MRTNILICLAIFNASNSYAKNYIVGGEEVGENDPIKAATVGIFDPSPDGHSGSLCTGTLIRKNLAVTAAHCIQSAAARPLVIFGRDMHKPDVVKRQSDGVAVHPKWNTHDEKKMDQGDIALVRFPGGLPKGYKTAPTAKSDKGIQNGAKVVLAGFGISDARKKTGAGRLRKTEVSVLKSRRGKSEMVLDQSHGHGACHGDSGGPAFIRDGAKIILAGVTNRGYPNNAPDDCNHQVVYTKARAYSPWIKESASRMGGGAPSSAGPELPGLMAKRTRHKKSRGTARVPKKHRKSRPRKLLHFSHKGFFAH